MPCHVCLAVPSVTLPYRAVAYRDLPSQPEPNLPLLALRGPTKPPFPNRGCHTAPGLATPRLASPRLASPCLPRPISPNQDSEYLCPIIFRGFEDMYLPQEVRILDTKQPLFLKSPARTHGGILHMLYGFL